MDDLATDSLTTASRQGSLGYSAPTAKATMLRLDDGAENESAVDVAAEVPVALVYNARPHAVMMTTPRDLEDFGVGFTITERIAGATEIRRVETVRYARGIELQIEIPAPRAEVLSERGRAIAGRTGCGLCGVEAIDDALRELSPVRSSLSIDREMLYHAGESLRDLQPLNNATNAIHAAAWVARDGELHVVREDVGRHNALDKVIGALARENRDPSSGFLIVTSRASYELVQKAAAANVALLAAVSRPTSLAIRLADEAGITLVGLLRGRTANVYTHPARLRHN